MTLYANRLVPVAWLLLTGVLAVFAASVSAAEIVRVIRVTDGDTFTASAQDRLITVRLAGIDAPETAKGTRDSGQPFARRARSHLADMVLNRDVEIRGRGTDRYGRILAEVFRGGINVNLEMVTAGLAEVYRGRPASGMQMDLYRRAEADARSHSREMWVQGEHYLSPQSWRRLERRPF
jgi:endonuclease YncB( thermonuclease family)